MASPASDFKRRARRDVELPSGLVVTIRRIQLFNVLDLGEFPYPLPAGEGEPIELTAEQRQQAIAYADELIVRACVSPRFTRALEFADDPLYVLVDDLEMGDKAVLTVAIKDLMLNNLKAEQVQSFREDAECETPAHDGGSVREAPHGTALTIAR